MRNPDGVELGESMKKKLPKSAERRERERTGEETGVAEQMAAGVDPVARSAILARIRRAKGQVEGIERMIDSERNCADIVTQISAARASLLAVAKALLNDHMKRTHAQAVRSDAAAMDDMYQELVELLSRMVR